MLICARLILTAIKIPQEAFPEAIRYLTVCVSGTVFIFIYNGISAVMRGMGDSKRPLMFVGIACFVNVALDLLLIARLRMGAAGAAYATVSAQAVSVIVSVLYLRIKKTSSGFDFRFKNFRFYPKKFSVLLKLGLPMSIHKTTASLSFVILTSFINRFGLAQAAVAGIVSKLDALVLLPFSAMQSSVAAMIGQNAGARRYDRVKETLFSGLKITMVCGVFFFALSELFPDKALAIFTTDPELIALGVPFFRRYSIEFLMMSFTFVLLALPVGTGYTFMSLVYTFAVSLAVRIPCAYLFAFVLGMGFNGVALGMAVAPVGALIAGSAFYFSKLWMKPVKSLSIIEPAAAE
jgi:putative MATE family efflux protein